MSDVVVSVVESNTAVTVTEQDVAVDVTENNVVVSVSTAGIQGVPGANNDPTYVTVRNATGATLAKGTIVYISGANGNNVQVSKAIATGDSTSARTIGWLAVDIPNNGSGLCMVEGYLEGLNTQGFTGGAQLYLSGTVAGGFTATKPVAPIHLVYVGVVTKVSAGDGHVFVKVQNGYELGELHDVLIVSPTNAQVLAYDSATQLWKNATNTPDGVTSITATAPLTGGTITSTGSIGLDQTALSITKSQVSDFTSGTVTSASTAQQAGTAVYSVNSGTAVYATTSGTAVSISGTITKSQVSDFTSGTVASAGTAQQSGTAVFANTSGTATYATTSGTATYADTSGTATYATDAGTAVYATTSGTAVTISGSITQSQVTNLTTDLAGKANLAGGNAFTGAQTINSGGTANKGLVVQGVASQAVNLFEIQDSTGAFRVRVNQVGNSTFAGNITSQNNALFTPFSAATVPLTVQGAASQTANLQEWQTSAGTVQARVTSGGSLVTTQGFAVLGGASISGSIASLLQSASASRIPVAVQGAASQSVDLQQWQNSAGAVLARIKFDGTPTFSYGTFFGTQTLTADGDTVVPLAVRPFSATQTADLTQWRNASNSTVGGRNANAQIFTGSTAPIQTAVGGGTSGASGTGSVATISTVNAHNLANGDRVTIAGMTPTGYNGTYIISGVSTFSFNIANATTGAQTVAGTVRVDAQTSATSRSAGTVGQVIRGAGSQSADLLQLQNSGALVQTYFDAFGNGHIAQAPSGSSFGLYVGVNANPAVGGIMVRGAASQTASLLEIQNSAASVLLSVTSAGNLNAPGQVRVGTTSGLGQLAVVSTNAATIGAVVQGAVSQTANLQTWEDSSSNVLARVNASGIILGASLRTINQTAQIKEENAGAALSLTKMTSQAGNDGAGIGRLYFRDGTNAGTLKLVVRAGAAGAETTILDNIPT